MQDEYFMLEALKEAKAAAAQGEMPVGAVMEMDGRIIARAHNECEAAHDPTAHAEILAIRMAAEAVGGWRLDRVSLYVTLEPCPMCAGAIMQARLKRLVFGAPDPGQGCAGSLYRITEDPAFPHFCPSHGGVLENECAGIMKDFFSRLRRKDLP